ncbi:branched-chain amino acid ABC transporter permease [Rhodococcus ruber]|uniref:branched-chain amino acid ABC transporter permease n=1 Tax=Rhodococcus ruber TaxID=1830 RepID=UPI00265D7C4D|nr:branched-chain amino acid ABC transporter permease [Rhodococcus ruber]MDO1480366.1 branched-chain amino acid ABC transporter permease [Rhodococcus ruber]MDO2380571.1 branched-chain amino acid ABC transporter permease [Rhodococcus ruber]
MAPFVPLRERWPVPRLAPTLLLLLLALAGLGAGIGTAVAQEPTPPPAPVTTAPQPSEGVRVSGSLNNAGERLGGVTVRARDTTGAEVAEATSAADGRWELTVPPGTYTFEVDEQSLPDEVSVQATVQRDVVAGRANTVIFSFGESRSGFGTSGWETVIRTVVDGLRFGLVIAIAGVGLSLIFGTTGLTNFAHGELVTLGAVAAWIFNVSLGIQLIPATLLAIAVGIAIGLLNNGLIWAPLRRRRTGLIAQLVVSIGLAISLRYLILALFSDRAEPFADYQGQRQLEWGPIAITPVNLACIVVSLVVLVGVALLVQRTRIGKAMRAVADNRDLAAASGIDVERVVRFVWGLGGGLAALGGVLFGLSELGGRVQWEMGFKLLLLMFAGITLGGLGTAYGALLGCVIVGLLVQLSTLIINPDLKYIGGLLVLIVVLVVRPQGILGSRARVG